MKKEHELFVVFWETHWRKHARPTDGRKSARDTFNTHMKAGADPQDMVDGAAWFIRNLKDKQFIPLAATWLNRGAYEDMCIQERDYQRQRADAAARRVDPPVQPKPEPERPRQKRDLKPEVKKMLEQMGIGGDT